MAKTVHIAVLGVALLVGAAFIAASAFTTATLSRDANIDVVADPSGIIGLEDGTSGGQVYIGSDGELKIDFDRNGDGLGVNVNSTYVLGNQSSPIASNQYAFNITNQDTVLHNIKLNYTANDPNVVAGGTGNNTEFRVYNHSTGSNVLTVSEEDNGGTFQADSGSSHAVVVVADTLHPDVDNKTTLNGTLNVTATTP